MNQEIKDKLKEYMDKNYVAFHGAYTFERSSGNEYDCFNDGMNYGIAITLYAIAQIVGIDVEKLEYPEEDEEDEEDEDDE